MINEREKKILKIIVEEYIKNARPVGSESICEELDLSSATIRNEMVVLEDLGYLEKTHTSSGRIPSEEGYRYYVDNLMIPAELTGEDVLKLQTIFKNNSLVLADPIKKSLEIISEITDYALVSLGNNSIFNKLKKVEIIPLDDTKILTMVITDSGYVEHKNMVIPDNIDVDEIKRTVELINKLLIGTPISEINMKLELEVKPVIAKYVKQHEILYNTFYSAFNDITSRNMNFNVVGKNNFLNHPEFNNIDKIKSILNKLDDVSSIKEMEDDKGINVYIGSENELDSDLTVIKSKYNYNGEDVTIAVIGPKRMEYDKVIGILEYLRKNIG